MRNRPKLSREGFTLIELLAVIGIISVLMALLIPAINRVRKSTRSTNCQSNMRQLLVAIHLYEQDNGFLPSIVPGSSGKPSADLVNRLQSRVENSKVFHCPEHSGRIAEESDAGALGWTTCYKYNDNGFFQGKSLDSPLINTTTTVLLIDSADWAPRHSGGLNLGFADGHVEWLSQAKYNGPDPMNSANTVWYSWGRK